KGLNLYSNLVVDDILTEEKVIQLEQETYIHTAIAELPRKYRLTIMLFYIDGFVLKDISQILDIPVGTVKAHLHRGREALRKKVQRGKGVGGRLNCKPDAIKLVHTDLDGDLTREQESQLLSHLTSGIGCQKHFHELKRTIQDIKYIEHIDVPDDFTTNVMNQLPEEKRRTKYMYWTKKHPVMISAAVLFVFLFSGVFSLWNQDGKLVVSKQ